MPLLFCPWVDDEPRLGARCATIIAVTFVNVETRRALFLCRRRLHLSTIALFISLFFFFLPPFSFHLHTILILFFHLPYYLLHCLH